MKLRFYFPIASYVAVAGGLFGQMLNPATYEAIGK